MRLYGLLEKLTKIIFIKGQTVTVEPNNQTTGAGKSIAIPDMTDNDSQALVLDKQTQTLEKKTLSSPLITGAANTTPAAGNVNLAGSANLLTVTTENTKNLTVDTVTANTTKVDTNNTTLQIQSSTATGTLSLAPGVTVSGSTKTVNLGTGGASGSTTAVNIGSATSGANTTTTINGANIVTAATSTFGPTTTGAASTLNLATAATAATFTKTVNLATGGLASSTTNVNIGSTSGGTTKLNSPTITTDATTVSLLDTTAATVTGFAAASSLTLGNYGTDAQTVNIAGGATPATKTKTINIGGNGVSNSTTNINLGSAVSGAVSTTKVNGTLQVTQTGTGDALIIEDSTSPDTTATRIDQSGQVGIGVAAGTVLSNALTVAGTTSLGNNLTFSTTATGVESSAATLHVGTTSAPTTVKLGTGGSITSLEIGTGVGAKTITLGNTSDTVNISGSVALSGNLTVNGTTTTVNSTTLEVADKNIVLNNGGTTASAPTAGISVEGDAGSTIAGIEYDPLLTSKWKLGDTGALSEVITAAGAQTLSGAKTLSSALTVTPTTNQLVLGTTNTTTLSATAPTASRTYTMPDVGANADFVMTAGTQTIAGNKTLSGTTYLSSASVRIAATSSVGPTETTATTTNLVNAITASGSTKTINIGASGASGSTTAITLGSGNAGALNTVTISGTGALRLPAGTSAQQPGQAGQPAAAQGMVRYNTSSGLFEGYDGSAWAGLGGSGSTADRFSQASPALTVGDVVYLNGSVYTQALATAATTAEVVGVISKDPSTLGGTLYEVTLVGEISGLLAADFDENALPAAGEVVFLSPTNAGKMTITEPSVVGQVSVPVGIVSGSGTLYVQPKRGVVVGGANVRTQIGLANNATTTVQNASGYDAGSLSGWVYIDATTDSRFYVQAQFAKKGAASDYNLSYQTTGDTPPAGFSVSITSAGLIQVTLPTIAGFASAYINFALNAPAVGATLPLQIASTSVSFSDIQAASAAGISVKNAAGSTTNVFVSDAGNVGVGTTSPLTRLHVEAATNTSTGVFVRNQGTNVAILGNEATWTGSGTSNNAVISAYGTNALLFGTQGVERMRIDASGIKQFSNGIIRVLNTAISSGAGTHFIKWNSSTGDLTYDTSSRLIKDHITDSPYGLATVLELKPRKYFRLDDQKEEVGFIADEVQAVAPEFVPMVQKSVLTKNEEDTEMVPGGVNYDKLTAILTKAIQEQQAQIEELKAKLAALEAK